MEETLRSRGEIANLSSITAAELRARRLALGLTQEQLAKRLGVRANTLARWERGELQPSHPAQVARRLDRLERLASRRTSRRRALRSTQDADVPNPLTSFVGREREVERVKKLLQSSRMVSLTGPGGVGKTRLALRVAQDIREWFADGVRFVPLAAVSDPALVLPAVVQALGIQSGGERALDALAYGLADKQVLLVLDNFEQVLPAAPSLATLLSRCSGLKLLVTSRAILRISGERVFTVPALALPDPYRSASAASVAESEAVRLFTDRAEACSCDFELNDDVAPAVADICHQLDGLPLAIELAAARVRVLPPRALLARLGRRLELLADGPTDQPLRHRSLRAAIAWSDELLGPSERALLRRLAVFVGGWTIDAAEAICAFDPRPSSSPTTLTLLTSLVDQALVQVDSDRHGGVRFRFLETIREYALERLAQADDEDAVRRNHAAYFLELAERATRETRILHPGAQRELALLEQEHDNLRAAPRWSLDSGAAGTTMRLAAALGDFWSARGHYAEGHMWLTEVLRLSAARVSDALRVRLLESNANCLDFLGDYAAALTLGSEALSVARSLEQRMLLARALRRVALAKAHLGDYSGATPLYEEAVALARAEGARVQEAAWLHNLAWVAIQQCEYPLARKRATESQAIAEELGTVHQRGTALKDLAYAMLGLGDIAAARRLLGQALSLARQADGPWLLGAVCDGLGHVAIASCELSEARSWFSEELASCQRIGERRGIVQALEGLASVLAREGRAPHAVQVAAAADTLRRTLQAPLSKRERQQLEGWLVNARQTLGAARVDAEWAHGGRLDVEAASALALAAAPVAGAHRVAAGVGLTPRQRELADLIARGLTNQGIAERLVLSERTVESHVSRILDRLNLQSRTQIAAWVLAPETAVPSLRATTAALESAAQ